MSLPSDWRATQMLPAQLPEPGSPPNHNVREPAARLGGPGWAWVFFAAVIAGLALAPAAAAGRSGHVAEHAHSIPSGLAAMAALTVLAIATRRRLGATILLIPVVLVGQALVVVGDIRIRRFTDVTLGWEELDANAAALPDGWEAAHPLQGFGMTVAWVAGIALVPLLFARKQLRSGRLAWSVGGALMIPWIAPGLGALVACSALAWRTRDGSNSTQ